MLASTSSEGLDQNSLSMLLPNAVILLCASTQARKAVQSKTRLQLEQDTVKASQLSIENEKLKNVKMC